MQQAKLRFPKLAAAVAEYEVGEQHRYQLWLYAVTAAEMTLAMAAEEEALHKVREAFAADGQDLNGFNMKAAKYRAKWRMR